MRGTRQLTGNQDTSSCRDAAGEERSSVGEASQSKRGPTLAPVTEPVLLLPARPPRSAGRTVTAADFWDRQVSASSSSQLGAVCPGSGSEL